MYKSIPISLNRVMRIYQLVKTMEKKNSIDKKNSVPAGKDTAGDMDAYKGIDAKIISELEKRNMLSEIENVFKDKTAAFIKTHIYLNESDKLVIKSLSKEYRNYIIGIKVSDISFGSMKYMLLNRFILIKIANYSTIYDSIIAGITKPENYTIQKQKNGSFRLSNTSRAAMEFTIE
jgi:hypothetical protein